MFFSGLGCACCHLKLLYTYHCLSFCPFSIGHCIVCPSSVYGYFWLPFGIFWPLYCLSFFGLRLLLITLWYLFTIVLSVLLRFTASDYPLVSSDYGFWLPFGICWTVYCLSFGLRLLITLWYLLAIVLSVILRFTLLITLWYLLAIALSVFLRFTATSDYRLVSFGHCIVCHSSVYSYFWLPFGICWTLYCLSFGLRLLITLWYLLSIVLSIILRFTATSDYRLVSFGHCIVCHSSVYSYFWLPFGIFWTLYCLSFFGLRLLITLWYLLDIVLSVILRFTASDYPLVSFGHCIVCHSSVYSYFWLPFGILWPLYCLSFFGLRFWLPFGIFWLLYCLSFFGLRLLLITIWYHLAIVLSVILRFTATSHYPLVSFGHSIVCHSYIRLRASDYSLVSFGHCIVRHSSVYGYFWLPFGIFWTLHCLSFFGLRLLMITLWYLLDIALSVILRFTAISDYPLVSFGHWLSVILLFTATSDYPLVSFGHCIVVCHSSVYGYFWLPFGIFWPLHCLSFLYSV
jgi:hypothetical protein